MNEFKYSKPYRINIQPVDIGVKQPLASESEIKKVLDKLGDQHLVARSATNQFNINDRRVIFCRTVYTFIPKIGQVPITILAKNKHGKEEIFNTFPYEQKNVDFNKILALSKNVIPGAGITRILYCDESGLGGERSISYADMYPFVSILRNLGIEFFLIEQGAIITYLYENYIENDRFHLFDEDLLVCYDVIQDYDGKDILGFSQYHNSGCNLYNDNLMFCSQICKDIPQLLTLPKLWEIVSHKNPKILSDLCCYDN